MTKRMSIGDEMVRSFDGKKATVKSYNYQLDAAIATDKEGNEWHIYQTLVESEVWFFHSPYGHKCECGTTLTLGKADAPIFHSDWCRVSPLYKNKEGS